jgi:hypothetical protein
MFARRGLQNAHLSGKEMDVGPWGLPSRWKPFEPFPRINSDSSIWNVLNREREKLSRGRRLHDRHPSMGANARMERMIRKCSTEHVRVQ